MESLDKITLLGWSLDMLLGWSLDTLLVSLLDESSPETESLDEITLLGWSLDGLSVDELLLGISLEDSLLLSEVTMDESPVLLGMSLELSNDPDTLESLMEESLMLLLSLLGGLLLVEDRLLEE